jgi:hypothetical protein
MQSLTGSWKLARDENNIGRRERWFEKIPKEAKVALVPGVIQHVFPGYHGVAWYWREFRLMPNPYREGRYLLRFLAVDYLAEVWVNGIRIGTHEGGENPFVLDITEAVRPDGKNMLAVRVLNPTLDPIDGISLWDTPHGCKVEPLSTGRVYNVGGICDSVELLAVPPVWVEDLFARPDPKTGKVQLQATIRNSGGMKTNGFIQFTLGPATEGETLDGTVIKQELPPGDTLVTSRLCIDSPRLWELNDPCLYRVGVRVWAQDPAVFHEKTTRCGFRDFRFENGYFRLNGRRLFLCGPLDLLLYPVGFRVPHDPDYIRRNVLAMKMMGFNICRLVFGGTTARHLDVFDEMGVMVYQEHYGSWMMRDSANLETWFNRSLTDIIRRDRNHPSIVMWGVLNETLEGRLFRHATTVLPLIRELDDSRMVMLNSGRFDQDFSIGSFSNPGSAEWDDSFRDEHRYPPVPHTEKIISEMRLMGTKEKPVFLSEYGTAGAIDYPRFLRHYENLGAMHGDDARYYADQSSRFMADWTQWRLEDCWARPEDFFAESHRTMAKLRWIGGNALRANPNLVGHCICGIADTDFNGCGLINNFREIKPGVIDAIADTRAPLRWSLFVEPVNVYRGSKIHLEAVLSNEDILRSGDYPARFQVAGPGNQVVFDRTITITLPASSEKNEPPFAISVFSEDLVIDGPSGKYRFLATLLRGGAAAGGETEFYVGDKAAYPSVDTEVVLWSPEPELSAWLSERGIKVRPFSFEEPRTRELILVGCQRPTPDEKKAFRDLVGRMARGAAVIFLSPEVFNRNPAWVGHLETMGTINLCMRTEKLPDWPESEQDYFVHDMWGEFGYRLTGLSEGDYTIEFGFCEWFWKEKGQRVFDVTVNGRPVLRDLDILHEAGGLLKPILRKVTAGSLDGGLEIKFVDKNPPAGASLCRMRVWDSRGTLIAEDSVISRSRNKTGWLPLKNKGMLVDLHGGWGYYRKDDWIKNHPVFDGLPSGGIMDYIYYRELISDLAFSGQDVADEALAGSIRTNLGYGSGLMLSAYRFGAGKFFLNTFKIMDNLGNYPPADRLLLNLLTYGSRELHRPLADLPVGFNEHLQEVRYM